MDEELKDLRQRCEHRIQELTIPTPFEIRAFCDAIAAARGRPIFLMPVHNKAGPCGLWLAGPSSDYIFYEQDTSPLHQEHIVLHEISHLLCDHQPLQSTTPGIPQTLVPNLSPHTISLMLQRTGYATTDEREAELLASLILERAVRTRRTNRPVPDGASVDMLGRLTSSLEGGDGERW